MSTKTDLITPEDEPAVRLLAFSAALFAIAIRGMILKTDDTEVPIEPVEVSRWAIAEARAIAEAIVAEGKRLQSGEL